jgi:hypothetical protein
VVVYVVAADIGAGMENIQEDDVDTDNSVVVDDDGEEENGIKVVRFFFLNLNFYDNNYLFWLGTCKIVVKIICSNTLEEIVFSLYHSHG